MDDSYSSSFSWTVDYSFVDAQWGSSGKAEPVLPVDINPREIVPDHVTDFIIQQEELVLGVVRYEIRSPNNHSVAAFYMICAMPLPSKWGEGMNLAPLSVFYRDETQFCSLAGINETAPMELYHTLSGIAYALTMQGVEVYTHQPPTEKEPANITVTLDLSIAIGAVHDKEATIDIGLPRIELFSPGRPPESLSLLRPQVYKAIGTIPMNRLQVWLSNHLKAKQELEEAISENPCSEIAF